MCASKHYPLIEPDFLYNSDEIALLALAVCECDRTYLAFAFFVSILDVVLLLFFTSSGHLGGSSGLVVFSHLN